MHDTEPDLETVHLVGDMPVSTLESQPSKWPAVLSNLPCMSCSPPASTQWRQYAVLSCAGCPRIQQC